MSGNVQKTPFLNSINENARAKVGQALQMLGKALPCIVVSVQGSIVRVGFEIVSGFTLPNVTIPIIGSEYIRLPIQRGCKGFTIPADAYLGGMSGLGGGVADLSQRANLSNVVFAPIGNKDWVEVDGDALVMYGPNGAVLRDQDSNSILTLLPDSVSLVTPAVEITTPSITFVSAIFVVHDLPASDPGNPGQFYRDTSHFVKVSV